MNIKKMLAGMLALMMALSICACSLAEGDAVTLAELKAQAPERLQMTVTTDAGNTITVDAPVILPDTDALPVLLCKRATFNTSKLRELYPLEKGTPRYVREADAYWNYDGSPLLCYDAGKNSALMGKTDVSARQALPLGEAPPENDLTLDDVLQIVYARNAEFGGDPSVDLRVYRANAMSGLYKMKMVKVTEGTSNVSYQMPAVDMTKPVKNASKGTWSTVVTQYLHGIPIFPESYLTEDTESGYDALSKWPYPIWSGLTILDEDTMAMSLSYLKELSVLQENALLASFVQVQSAIERRIRSGQLKSVYQVELGYSVALVKGDSFWDANNDPDMNARFVLCPVWKISGYDLKDCSHRYYQAYTEPDEQTVMQDLDGDFAVRLDAVTAQPLMAYEYDGEVAVQ